LDIEARFGGKNWRGTEEENSLGAFLGDKVSWATWYYLQGRIFNGFKGGATVWGPAIWRFGGVNYLFFGGTEQEKPNFKPLF